MPEQAVAFDLDTAGELVGLLDRQDAAPRLPSPKQRGHIRPNGMVSAWALITSTTTTAGRYPGKIQLYDHEASSWSDLTDGTCWVVDANTQLLGANRYDCKIMGILASDGKPVLMTGTLPTECTEVVVDCVDGDLVYEDIRVIASPDCP